MSNTPTLDHLNRYHPKLMKRLRLEPFEGLRISGRLADDIGSRAMQELATLKGKSIIIGSSSKFHQSGAVFNPRKRVKP